MRNRVFLLLALGGVVQIAAANPFAAPVIPTDGVNVLAGASARYAETFALLEAAWAKGKGPDSVLFRLADHLDRINGLQALKPLVERRVKAPGRAAGKETALLRGLYGRALVAEARALGPQWGGVFIVNGRRMPMPLPQRLIPPAAKKLYTEAVEHLRSALLADPSSDKLRVDLAQALEAVDPKAHSAEITTLRTQAAVIVDRRLGTAPELPDLHKKAAETEQAAQAAEREDPPQHDKAERLHKQALVLAYCSHTIPFDYEPAVYGPVSLLASRGMLNDYLTRRYKKGTDTIGEVPPRVYPVRPAKRKAILESLSHDASDAAAAALLGAMRHAFIAGEAAAAAAAIRKAGYPSIRVQLGRLLAAALFREPGYSPVAQRELVALAADLEVKDAREALRKALPMDRDLHCPRGIAEALGRLGEPKDANRLLAIAADPLRDVFFRREAVAAFGRLAPDRLDDLPNEPVLALAVAAARYRQAPTEDGRGRILAAIGTQHETDDAAQYCVEFGITAALPALEEFATGRADDPATETVRRAIVALKNKARADAG